MVREAAEALLLCAGAGGHEADLIRLRVIGPPNQVLFKTIIKID